MADLTDIQSTQPVKVVGSDSAGVEQTPVQSTSNGALHVNLRNNAGTEMGTTANPEIVAGAGVAGTPAGGVHSVQGVAGGTAVPISAASLPLPTGAATETTLSALNTKVVADFGASATAIRVASLLGNAAGAAAFGAGTTGAQVLRVVLPTDQTAIPVAQSGTWNINNISGTISLPTGAATETTLAALNAKFGSLGQKTMAGSAPVVIASDQSVLPVSFNGSDRLGTGTISALNGTYAVNTQGMSTIMFHLTGTWVATLAMEATVDGSTWFAIEGYDDQTDLRLATVTSNRVIKIVCGAYQSVRLKASLYTSGTVSIASDAAVGLNAADSSDTIRNNGAAIPPQSQLVGGSDGTNIIPLSVDSNGRLVTSSLTGFGADFAFGDITTSATTRVLVKRTAYAEQTTNGQRSIASSSANDTSAGTGAQTVKITYLDQTGAGPFTETLTLNGTTGVNTVATNICYIEQVEVITGGSTGSNVGIISLYTAINKGGSVIGTIAATDNQTFWAHHYVPTGKICNITGISCGHNGTTVGSGALFTINWRPLNNSAAVEVQASDFVRLYGQTSTFARNYSSPIKVTGPARLQVYVTPETASSTIYRAAFDFFEP